MTTTHRRTQRTRRFRALLILTASGSAVVAGTSLAAADDETTSGTDPVCTTIFGDDLGRDDRAARTPLDGTGLALVRDRSRLTVEGHDPEPVSLTAIDADGTRRPGYAADDGLHAEVYLPDYAGVEVCWTAPAEVVTTEPAQSITETLVTTEPDVATTEPDGTTTAAATSPSPTATAPSNSDLAVTGPAALEQPAPPTTAHAELARTGASPLAGLAAAGALVAAGTTALVARHRTRPAGSR